MKRGRRRIYNGKGRIEEKVIKIERREKEKGENPGNTDKQKAKQRGRGKEERGKK